MVALSVWHDKVNLRFVPSGAVIVPAGAATKPETFGVEKVMLSMYICETALPKEPLNVLG